MTCCRYSHDYACVQHLDVKSFYSFFSKKNEVVDVQNEVAMDICLDLTCAWQHQINVFLTNLVLSEE